MIWNQQALSDGPSPRWLQIADRLREGIESGHFAPGQCLPSETELNRLFGVSRTTARAALDKLRNEGLITRRSGKGSIVVSPIVEQPVTHMASFSEDMAARGLTASYDTLSASLQSAPENVCEAFGLAADSPCLQVYRRLLADGDIIGLSHSWISPLAIGQNDLPSIDLLNQHSLYNWLENECAERVTNATETIEAAIVDAADAKALSIQPNSAVLIARRQSSNESGLIIEHAAITYRADRYRYSLTMKRST